MNAPMTDFHDKRVMSERISKTQRWLDLIALLLRHQRIPASVDEIMEQVPGYARQWESGDDKARSSVRRTFERDKDELRELGIPIESVNYNVNFGNETIDGYRIGQADFYLPYLRILGEASNGSGRIRGLGSVDLSPADAAIAVDALRRIADVPAFPFAAEARTALAKISFDIDTDRFPLTPAIQIQAADTGDILERLQPFSEALLNGKRVSFRYHGIRREGPTDRTVEPYALFLHREWYLVGRDVDADGLRIFRISRTEKPVPNTRAPKDRDYEIPADFDVRDYVEKRSWELGNESPMTADVLFRFPRSLLADRANEGELVESLPDGSSIRRFTLTDPGPFLRWILSTAGETEILKPADLREEARRLADSVIDLYSGGHG